MILLEIGTRLDREVFSLVYTFKIFLKVLLLGAAQKRKGPGRNSATLHGIFVELEAKAKNEQNREILLGIHGK